MYKITTEELKVLARFLQKVSKTNFEHTLPLNRKKAARLAKQLNDNYLKIK